jgi:hypothetical protein
MVYFGSIRERGKPMVKYLQEVSGSTLPPRTNPANWMLEVLSTSLGRTATLQRCWRHLLCVASSDHSAKGCKKGQDYAAAFASSKLYTYAVVCCVAAVPVR